MTITEKILARHAGRDRVAPGDNIWVDVDILMTHDVCGPPTIDIFRREFGADAAPWDKEKLVIIPDHYIFTKNHHANRNVELLRAFAAEHDLPYYYDPGTPNYKGVCHMALAGPRAHDVDEHGDRSGRKERDYSARRKNLRVRAGAHRYGV